MTTPITAHRPHAALLASGALLATLALASCGGSDDKGQPSSTEAWAGTVCSTASNWLGAVSDAQATLTDTSNLSADSLRKAFDDVNGATETLVTNLKNLKAPDTQAGDEAQAQLSSLSGELQQQRDTISQAADQANGSVQGLLAQVSTVTGAVATMFSDISKTIDDIRQVDGADELKKAFQDASACQELRASASPSA